MNKRMLGKTGVLVSELTFGGAAISGEGGGYGFGDISEQEATKLIHAALDFGLNFFDTAPIYGFGLSEKRLGAALKKKRDQIYLVSKSGVSWHESKRVNMTNDPKIAESMLHQSLKDLQTDYIDLYMIHWPDEKVDIRKTLDVLKKAQDQHKIRWIGLCNTNLEDLEKAKEICRIDVVQSELNYFQRAAESDLFPYLAANEIGFMSWGTLDKGILTGRVTKERSFDQSDCRSWAPWWDKKDVLEKAARVERMKPVIEGKGHTLLEWALGFNLSFNEVSTAICGARSVDQLRGLIEAYSKRPQQKTNKFLEIER